MSYLNPLRLHFSGLFEAAVSTVNNDPVHYDSARFKPSYAETWTGQAPDELNGWFNPDGSGDWRLHGCAVTSAFLPDGAAAGPATRSWTASSPTRTGAPPPSWWTWTPSSSWCRRSSALSCGSPPRTARR